MDRLDAMALLVAVVDEGSLSAAARRLRIPLTTVSRKVADLEQHLQARLLIRTSRRVELTEAGRDYVDASKRILDQVQEAERAAAGEYRLPRGELTVTAPVVFGRRHVLPVAAAFLQAHAEITIRMLLADRSVNMIEDHVDVAVRIGPLADSAMLAMRVGSVRRVVCATPAYLAARGTPLAPDDLCHHDIVDFQGFPPAREWVFTRGRKRVAVPVRPRLSVNTAEAAVDAAVAGIGLTRVLSYQVADEVRAGALQIVLGAHEPPPMPVSFVYPAQGLLPLKLRSFLDWCAPLLRARLAAL